MTEIFQKIFPEYPVILAPMAGVTDWAFRSICVEEGADLTYTEMISAKGLYYGNAKTEGYLALAPNETQVAVQLFGREPELLAREAFHVEETLGEKLRCIDINMGCPARKIAGKGDGSALMKEPELAGEIVSALKRAVSVPVTAKFRRGYYLNRETAPEFARVLEQAGIDWMTVHGRFAEQMYRGISDRGCIARVKSAVKCPVVGNGDVFTWQDGIALKEETGCDGIMVARGVMGNPWIISRLKDALAGHVPQEEAGIEERMAMALRHAMLLGEEPGGLAKMRKHAMCYVNGLPGARAAREQLCSANTVEDFRRIFEKVVYYAS